MSAIPKSEPYLTPQEYLACERAANFKSEYFNGYVIEMAGASYRHNIIAANAVASLVAQLRGRPCVAFGSDMKVRVEKANLFRYPDVSAVCGPIDFYDSQEDVYSNPALVLEVLLPKTERYDRANKFALYRLIPAFSEYVLVAQDRVEVEVHRRQPDGRWDAIVFNDRSDLARLEAIGCDLAVADLYDKVEMPA